MLVYNEDWAILLTIGLCTCDSHSVVTAFPRFHSCRAVLEGSAVFTSQLSSHAVIVAAFHCWSAANAPQVLSKSSGNSMRVHEMIQICWPCGNGTPGQRSLAMIDAVCAVLRTLRQLGASAFPLISKDMRLVRDFPSSNSSA